MSHTNASGPNLLAFLGDIAPLSSVLSRRASGACPSCLCRCEVAGEPKEQPHPPAQHWLLAP